MAYYRNPLEDERQRQLAAMMRGQMSPGMTNPMLMNEFDAQAQAVAQGRMSPAMPMGGPMPDQSAILNRDIASEQRGIDRQMDYANQLRRSKTPGVRQVGNVAATNIWEGLETGFNRALGGYLAGKARTKEEELNEARAQQRALERSIEDERYAADLALRERGVAVDEESLNITRARNEADERLRKAQLEFDKGEMENVSLMDINDPTKTMRVLRDSRGVDWMMDENGKPAYTIATPSNYVEFSAGAGGTTTSAADLADFAAREGIKQEDRVDLEVLRQEGRVDLSRLSAEQREELARLNSKLRAEESLTEDERKRKFELEDAAIVGYDEARGEVAEAGSVVADISSMFEDPLFPQFVGGVQGFGQDTLAGPLIAKGQAFTGAGENAAGFQRLDNRIERLGQQDILEYLEVVAPASEFEYVVAKRPVPDKYDLPSVHVDYHASSTFGDMERAHNEAVARAGKIGPKERSAAEAKRDADLTTFANSLLKSAAAFDYPIEELKRFGVSKYLDPKVVELAILRQKELMQQGR